MDIKKVISLFIITFAVALTANIPIQAVEEVHDHDDLFNTVEIKDGKVLNIKDCVALAFKNSPKIKRKKYELDVAKSNLGLAKSRFFPVIGAGVGINFERNSDSIYYDKRYRDLPAVGVYVNQLVWDFGKSLANIKMEKFYKIGAEYEFMDALCYTLFDTKAKYYNLLKAKAIYNISKNDVELNKRFLDYSKPRGGADFTTAEVNLNKAQIKLIEAENSYNNAKYDLSNAMYIDSQPDYDIENTPTFTFNNDFTKGEKQIESEPFEPYVFPFDTKNATEIAYKNSPDLQVLVSTKNAMEQALKYAKRSYFPELSAELGYGYNNSRFVNENSGNHNLRVGVNLATSVNFMELKHSIKGASAQLNIADNEINLFKKDLYYELQRAFNNVERAKKQVPTAKKQVTNARKNIEIVESKYLKKQLDYTALQDARTDYINALNIYIDSIYNYNISLIQVEMAMHYHMIDIHHKSEHALHYHSSELLEHLNKALECDEKEINSKSKKKKKNKRNPN